MNQDARADPGALVERYLELCEARDLDAASALLAPGALVVFPGGVRHADLRALVADARTRYQRVAKRRDLPWVAERSDGAALVVSLGTLRGVGLDGTPFDGVRYADLFVVRDGLIAEQHVFNDLAEHGVVGAGPQTATTGREGH